MINKSKSIVLKFITLGAIATALTLYSLWNIAVAQDNDQSIDLIKQEGWKLVQDNCTECHTTQIITQNSGTREVWKSRIEWMQESQGLGELEDRIENSILDYLAENYAQKTASRRPALPAHLMPVNSNPTAN